MTNPENVRFDADGLIPAIVQEAGTGTVLMVAYMNRESLDRTLASGDVHFWSRSRGELWRKGATSGNTQRVVSVSLDCDGDALLVQVEQTGNACHTGAHSCFFQNLAGEPRPDSALAPELARLEQVIRSRKQTMPEGSYTTGLFKGGLDRILKKVGEESGEVMIAAKNRSKPEIVHETADLIYHLLVLLAEEDVALDDIAEELKRRKRKGEG